MSIDTDVDIVRKSCLILDKKPRKLSAVCSMVFGNSFRSRLVFIGLSWASEDF